MKTTKFMFLIFLLNCYLPQSILAQENVDVGAPKALTFQQDIENRKAENAKKRNQYNPTTNQNVDEPMGPYSIASINRELSQANYQADATGCPNEKKYSANKQYDAICEASGIAACNTNINTNDYSVKSCIQYQFCAHTLFYINSKNQLGYGQEYIRDILPIFSKKTADRYLESMLKKKITDIEDFKQLRKYAMNLSIPVTPKTDCEDVSKVENTYNRKKASCDISKVDEAFLNIQSNCNSKSEYKCYESSELAPYKNRTPTDEEFTNTDAFLDMKTNNLVSESIEKYNDGLQALALFYVKEKNNKKLPFLMKTLMNGLNLGGRLDPALNYIRKSDTEFKLFLENLSHLNLSKKGTIPTKVLGESIQKYSVKVMTEVFSPAQCSKIPSVKAICETTNELLHHNRAGIPRLTSNEIEEMFKDDLIPDSSLLNEINGTGKNFTPNQVTMLMKHFRCVQFNKDVDYAEQTNSCDVKVTDSNMGVTPTQIDLGSGQNSNTTIPSSTLSNNSLSSTNAPDLKPASASIETATKQSETSTTDDQKDKLNNQAQSTLNAANSKLAADSNLSNNPVNLPSVINPEEPDKKDGFVSAENNFPTSALQERVSKLNSEIASSEEKLAQLKDPTSNEVTSLKSEIDDLKNQLKNAISNAAQSRADTTTQDSRSSSIVGQTDNLSRISEGSNFQAPSSSIKSLSDSDKNYSGPSSNLNNGAFGAIDSASIGTGNASGSKVTQVAQAALLVANAKETGLVLTQLDGLSPTDAANAINEKIAAGQPVYIVEDGVIKIPEVDQSGKVVLDENGKPKFKIDQAATLKLAQAKSSKSRRPASIAPAAPADVRRADEKARPRILLEDLNKVIRDAKE